jgi:hypothetical protein
MISKRNILKPKPKEPKEHKPRFTKLKKMLGFKIPESAITAMETPKDIISGDIIERNESKQWFNILLWLTLLAFIYITNNYWAEEKIREINHKQKEIQELRYQYISTRSKLMTMSRQSEVFKRLEKRGFKENKEPLKVIKITKNELSKLKQ